MPIRYNFPVFTSFRLLNLFRAISTVSFKKNQYCLSHGVSYWSCRKPRVYEKTTALPERERFYTRLRQKRKYNDEERETEANETEVEVGASRCVKASAHTFVW